MFARIVRINDEHLQDQAAGLGRSRIVAIQHAATWDSATGWAGSKAILAGLCLVLILQSIMLPFK